MRTPSKYPEHVRLLRNAASKRYKERNHEKVRASQKIYKKKNPDKCAEWQRKANLKRRPQLLEYYRKYNASRKVETAIKRKKWAEDNPELVKEQAKKRYWKDRDKNLAANRAWREANRDRLKASQSRSYQLKGRHRRKFRRDTIPQVKLDSVCRTRVATCLKEAGLKKSDRMVELLGCTAVFMREFIEHQFSGEMSWINWGSVWEIDHIIPISKFDLTVKEERFKAFHYSNCRPLLKLLNRQKNDSLPGPHQPFLL